MNDVFYIGIDPVIFRLGTISISWYGLMIALAVAAVVVWLARENKKEHLSYNIIFTALLIGIPSGIVFAKLLNVIDFFDYYRQNPGLILSGEGWAIWGMVLGVTLGVWIYSRVSRRFRFTLLADMIAPGIILGQAIGRVGCTLNGCCYGIESNSPLAVVYTSPNSFAPIGIPTLPTTVFEIFYNLIVFGILLSLRKKLKPEGSIFLIYLAFYAAWRFASDFLRDGTPFLKNIHFLTNIPFISNLHEAQVIGLIVMLVTVPLIIWKVRWADKAEVVEAKSIPSLRTP